MGSARINAIRQKIGAFDFTEPLNKNNELGRRLRRKRIDDTQPHIGRGKPYRRKGRIKKEPTYIYNTTTFPMEKTKPGTMEEVYQPSYPEPPPFARPKVQVKDRKPGTLFDNEGGLQDREFAADSLDDPSMLDPDKWSGEDLKELEDMTATPSLTNYTTKQPLRDWIHQPAGGAEVSTDPYPNVMNKKISEEAKYIENPQYKIKPIKPTRMEWRAIISAKSARIQMARERLAIGIRVSPTTKRVKRVKKVLDYEYPYQGPEMPTTKHPKTNIPKLTGPRTTTGEERRRKVTKKERKSLDSYIKDDKKIDPRNAKLRQRLGGYIEKSHEGPVTRRKADKAIKKFYKDKDAFGKDNFEYNRLEGGFEVGEKRIPLQKVNKPFHSKKPFLRSFTPENAKKLAKRKRNV